MLLFLRLTIQAQKLNCLSMFSTFSRDYVVVVVVFFMSILWRQRGRVV